MLIYDNSGLNFKEAIIDTAEAKLFYYTHDAGSKVLMAKLAHPSGRVFFETNDLYLRLFISNKINLQFLFEASASIMVTIAEEDEYKLYMRSDVDIRLCEGEKILSQF